MSVNRTVARTRSERARAVRREMNWPVASIVASSHRRFERLHLADAIGEARAALVEHQDPAACGEPLEMSREEWLLPRRQQVTGDSTHDDDVRRARPDDL